MIEVNLIPDHQKSSDRRRLAGARNLAGGFRNLSFGGDAWATALGITALVVPGLVLFLWLGQRSEAATLEDRMAEVTADSARLADLRLISDSLISRQTAIRERVSLIDRLDRNRFVWPHMMDEISRAVPRLAWMTMLRQVSPLPSMTVEIQGMAANPLAITEFVRNLQASPFVGEVRILGTQRQELEGELAVQKFTLMAEYAAPPGGARTTPIISSSAGR